MIFPKLDKESPLQSESGSKANILADAKHHDLASAEFSLCVEDDDDDDDDDDDEDSEDDFLTDDEYDILDASDEEAPGGSHKVVQK